MQTHSREACVMLEHYQNIKKSHLNTDCLEIYHGYTS